ncbi:hypothetical protein JXC34_02210 [Candidatus Woesearchaeota archaeon]|nr:hypothetical protein [Candidatus Woesearchaeota archaeon]
MDSDNGVYLTDYQKWIDVQKRYILFSNSERGVIDSFENIRSKEEADQNLARWVLEAYKCGEDSPRFSLAGFVFMAEDIGVAPETLETNPYFSKVTATELIREKPTLKALVEQFGFPQLSGVTRKDEFLEGKPGYRFNPDKFNFR